MRPVKAILASAAVILGGIGTPVLAGQQGAATAAPVSVVSDDLPLTPRFASLLTSYRNCVLIQVDAGSLDDQRTMARQALSACAISRGEMRSQLLADIRASNPALAHAAAVQAAEAGLEQIDPMIEAAAIDRAHMAYARNMY
jgi:hypothetical protein